MNAEEPQGQPEDSEDLDLTRAAVIRNLETGATFLATEFVHEEDDGTTVRTYVPLADPTGPEGNS